MTCGVCHYILHGRRGDEKGKKRVSLYMAAAGGICGCRRGGADSMSDFPVSNTGYSGTGTDGDGKRGGDGAQQPSY